MTADTPLQQAVAAWSRGQAWPRDGLSKQNLVDDAVALAETGAFSTSHIILITGLPHVFVRELLKGKNREKRGGRFNPESLPIILEVWYDWARTHTCDHSMVRTAVNIGTSPRMVAKLTGIPKSSIYLWMEKK